MRRILMAVLILGVAGCVTTPPKFTESDLAQARQFEQAQTLYDDIQSELSANPSSANEATYRTFLSRLGSRLASLRAEAIRSRLDQQRLDSGAVPLATLASLRQSADKMESWDAQVWRTVVSQIEDELRRTESLLERARSRMENSSPTREPVAWVERLERIATLTGSEADLNQLTQGREEVINSLLELARSEIRSLDYQSAIRRTQQALELRPSDPVVESLQQQARAAAIASRLNSALETGNIGRAEILFDEIHDQEWSPESRTHFDTPLELMGNYYAASLPSMLETRQYERAYRALTNLRKLDTWLKRDFARIALESQFAELMYELAASAGAQGLTGTEYGFLLLIEEFNPGFVNLERIKRETGERLLSSAVQWVSTPAIRGDDRTRNVGSRISSAVAAYLLKNIPGDLRIVEREQLGEIQRERRMTEADALDERAQDGGLRAADLLIQGNVLDVRVDREDRSGRRTMRVITGTKEVPNPKYEAYRSERGRRPDGEDAPPETIEEEIEEDITVEVSIHRKTGFVAVSYRLVEAESANILLTNTVNREQEFTDESSEGIEMGNFSQPFKLADLPSDGEIINELVDEVALAIGQDLIQVLADPERRYFSRCEQFAGEDSPVAAAEECARAVILIENKGGTRGTAHELLRDMTLKSGIRPD